MEKLELLLKKLEPLLKIENDELNELITEDEVKDDLIKMVEDLETQLSKALNDQRKFITQEIESYTGKSADSITEGLIKWVGAKVFTADIFPSTVEKLISAFFLGALDILCPIHMKVIDSDIAFKTLSKKTLDWVMEWSPKLGEMMKLKSHTGVEKLLSKGLEKGWGIEKIVMEMKDLSEFNRTRARTTAITEVLAANSVAQHESYLQSPAVEGKKWLHSGSKGINARKAHIKLSGTEIGMDELFEVNGHNARFPRDHSLPPEERINCHCTMSPVVNEKILGLSAKEKEKIREETLKELNK